MEKQLQDLLKNLDRVRPVLDRNVLDATRELIIAILERVQHELEQRNAPSNGGQQADEGQSIQMEPSSNSNPSTAAETRPKLPRASTLAPRPKGGAPISDINKETLERLLLLDLTVNHIATAGLLGGQVHPNTTHNFMKRNSMQRVQERYSTISDEDLKRVVEGLNKQYPNSGSAEMMSLLKSGNPPLIVQRDRCRKILAEVDPIGTARRWAQAIKRRQYSVQHQIHYGTVTVIMP
eukprot:Seg3779.4 transcript_id=Seg3779.4/GoldUCD/mRNA.D3Y31 product="hypothetical protein" protein_id=Seg3779.4/GoldUCD/D3Y31